jgi:hypothetical protein
VLLFFFLLYYNCGSHTLYAIFVCATVPERVRKHTPSPTLLSPSLETPQHTPLIHQHSNRPLYHLLVFSIIRVQRKTVRERSTELLPGFSHLLHQEDKVAFISVAWVNVAVARSVASRVSTLRQNDVQVLLFGYSHDVLPLRVASVLPIRYTLHNLLVLTVCMRVLFHRSTVAFGWWAWDAIGALRGFQKRRRVDVAGARFPLEKLGSAVLRR